MAWDVDISLIKDWLDEQDAGAIAKITVALDMLAEKGPALGRPLVDRLQGSRIHNLKELRISSGLRSEIRILFVFDLERRAVLPVGGDKAVGKSASKRWSKWYGRNIALAERRYEEYLHKRER